MSSRPAEISRGSSRGLPAFTGLLATFLRPYTGQLILVVVLMVGQGAGNLYLPILNADIINTGVVKGDVGYIWRVGGFMLVIGVLVNALGLVAVYWAAHMSMAVGADLRAAVYQRVLAFSERELSRFGISTLITRNVNDVQQVQLFLLMTLSLLVSAIVMVFGSVILAAREDAVLSLLLVGTVPLMLVIIGVALFLLVPLSRSVQGKIDRITAVLREQITGVRVVRAFLRTRFEQDRFGRANLDMTRTGLRIDRIIAILFPVATGLTSLLTVAVIWFGSRLVSEGSMPIGTLTPFVLYIMQILAYIVVALLVVILMPHAMASAERIDQVLDVVPAIAEPARPVIPARATGDVEFRQAGFGYPGSERPVLHDLTFAFRAGQTSAIIGGTGSGKTTVLNLIARFLDVTDGAVLVSGTDVRQQPLESLRAGIGLVPQTPFLFAGTVASNLRFASGDATDEQLWRALDIAQARDFVASMPGQLHAPIDQGGTNVSGGQRQRLSIARALVRQPRLYLLDDCFSALDPVTDARLRAALRAATADAAVVIVAQRVSTIMDADQIIVLDAGSVVGLGTHEQLLADCVPYQEIVASQLGEGASV